MTTEQADPARDLGVLEPTGVRRADHLAQRLLREPLAVASVLFLALVVVLGLFAPVLAPFDPNFVDVRLTNAPPFTSEFLLGGDPSGRDVLSRLMWASRGTLLGCVVVLVVSVAVGVTGGLLAGFFRGPAETIGSWISDAIMALPGVVLLIALYSIIGPSILTAMAVFGLLIAPANFRLVRAVVSGVRDELYIDAATVSGLSDLRILFRHVLMAVRAPIIIQSAFVLAAGIGIQAALEFLGLGDPRQPSWGAILQISFEAISANGAAVIAPALLVSLATLAFVLLGNALRDTLQTAGQRRPLTGAQRAALHAMDTDSDPVPGDALLHVTDLRIAYPGDDGPAEVVRGVGLTVRRGEIHGLVGESGSGKTQTAFGLLGLLPREAAVGGAVWFDGEDLVADPRAMRAARGARIAYVPQEPMSNLDPTITIGRQLVVGLRAVRTIPAAEARRTVLDLLARLRIGEPERVFDLYPHQVSGGMAQRVLIAGAVAGDPDLLVADEPTTALDVTVQAEVLDLLRELRDERGLGMVLVTHDLGVVADLCDTVSVMRGGLVVESRPVRELFADPRHPYTRELLSSTLDPEAAL